MKIELLLRARSDLQLIEEFQPKSGKTAVQAILQALKKMEKSQESSQKLSEKLQEPSDFGYLPVEKWLVIYKIKAQGLKVYRIYDARQDWLQRLGL